MAITGIPPVLLTGTLISGGVLVLGLAFPPAAAVTAVVLLATATGVFAAVTWLFRSQSQTDGWYGYAAVIVPLILTTVYLLGATIGAVERFGSIASNPHDEAATLWIGGWETIGDLGLTLFTLTSLLIVAQQRENWLRHAASGRIEASEQRFRDIAEVAADWFWETGPDLRYKFFSDRTEQVTGLKVKDLLGKTRRDLLGGDPNELSWQMHLQDLEARRPFRNFEYILAGTDGRHHHLRVSGKPVYDSDGNFLGYRGTGTDLTAEVEARQKAEWLDRWLRDSVESMPHGVALFDAQDRLIYCNSKHKAIYPAIGHIMVPGRTFEEILNDAVEADTFAIESDREEFIRQRLAAHRNPTDEPIQQQQKDGRWVQIGETKITEGGTIVSWTDITHIEQREHALAILVEGGSGEGNFLDAAARALAFGLGYRWAGVSRYIGDGKAKVLAMWDTDRPAETFEYELANTPCAELANGKENCFYPERVAERFPQDADLRNMGAASYRGQAIRGADGLLIGHIFAINDEADSAIAERHELMDIVARWVGIAIQQQNAEEALRNSENRSRDFAASASDWFWETDLDQRFTYYSSSELFDDIWNTLGSAPGSPPAPIGRTRQELWKGIAEPDHSATIAEFMAA